MSDCAEIDMSEMQEIIGDFLIEAGELVDSLDNSLVKLESSPNDLDLLNEIFRAAHTIKGSSSFLGFEQVTELTHRMEDILNQLRRAEMVVTPEIMDIALESLDVLKLLLQNVRDGKKEKEDIADLLARLAAVSTGQGDGEAVASTSPVEAPVQVNMDETVEAGPDQIIESPTDVEPETVQSGTSSEATATASRKARPEKRAGADQTIRVDVERLDTLMNLTGELTLGRNCLQQVTNRMHAESDGSGDDDDLSRATASINHITTEIQLAVMKMRMQPISKVFSKFPRLVRDLARDSGKEIALLISGETTELDKSVIEEIGDPLVHIIRNSCDHGIESPDDRVAKGKPRNGTVKLSASQEGSSILVKIEDDGKGFDIDAIREKAVERGLASREDVDRLPEKDVFRFIFEPGFSTVKVVSDVSGRGVGMDVVRTNIEKLNGLVDLQSTKDVGTIISIKLPLTLAIIDGLLVESDEDVYILPLSSVCETVKKQQADICSVNCRPVMRLRDEIIPVINLADTFHLGNRGLVDTEKPYILVVGLAEKKLGIDVDRFLGQEEIVIKSLGHYLGTTEGIAGATILGDGRIRLIIDLHGLFNLANKAN